MTENHITASTEAGHGSVASYIVGYVLSIVFTIIAFYMVMEHTLSTAATAVSLGLLAVLQVAVQSIFFLHVSTAPEKRVDFISYIFFLFVAIVIIFGTLFVMHNASYNMMSR